MKKKLIKIENKKISDLNEPFFIAEAGINYDGKFKKCFDLIDAAKKSGADAIKFQTHFAKHEMLDTNIYLAHSKKETVFQLMKRCELTKIQHLELKKYAQKRGLIFLSTPFSLFAAKMLKGIGVSAFKIGSGECNNIPLLDKISKYKKPMIVSTGMNNINSISKTVNLLKKNNKNNFALMHCVSMYPMPAKKTFLNTIGFLKKKFNCPVGFSDHSYGTHLSIAAIANGANIIEKHFTVSKKWPGPDIDISLDPSEFKQLVQLGKDIYNAKGIKKTIFKEEVPVTKFAYASVVSIKDISKNERLTEKNIWVKRPGTGKFLAKDFKKLIGKKAKRKIKKDKQLVLKDIF